MVRLTRDPDTLATLIALGWGVLAAAVFSVCQWVVTPGMYTEAEVRLTWGIVAPTFPLIALSRWVAAGKPPIDR